AIRTIGATITASTITTGGTIRSPRPPRTRGRRRGPSAISRPVTSVSSRPVPAASGGRGHLFPRLLDGGLVGLPRLQVHVGRGEHVRVADVERLGDRLVLDLARLDRRVGAAVIEVVREAEAGLVVDVGLDVVVGVV